MKKIALIELLKEKTGGTVSPGMLNSVLGRAFNQLLYSTFRSNMSSYDSYAKLYKGLDIEKDTELGVYFTRIPANIIQLPTVTDGVRNITTMKRSGLTFAPITEVEAEIHEGLEVSTIADTSIPIGFMLSKTEDGEVIQYSGIRMMDITKVNVLLLIPIEDLEMDEEIKIPSGKDVELIEIAMQIISGKPPTDNVNDGNTKTR